MYDLQTQFLPSTYAWFHMQMTLSWSGEPCALWPFQEGWAQIWPEVWQKPPWPSLHLHLPAPRPFSTCSPSRGDDGLDFLGPWPLVQWPGFSLPPPARLSEWASRVSAREVMEVKREGWTTDTPIESMLWVSWVRNWVFFFKNKIVFQSRIKLMYADKWHTVLSECAGKGQDLPV